MQFIIFNESHSHFTQFRLGILYLHVQIAVNIKKSEKVRDVQHMQMKRQIQCFIVIHFFHIDFVINQLRNAMIITRNGQCSKN